MSENINKVIQALSYELKHSCKHKKFDIKGLQTYGTYRTSQLQSLKHIKIRQDSLKQLLTKSLKVHNLSIKQVCYLVDPILNSIQQIQNSINFYHDYQCSHSTANNINTNVNTNVNVSVNTNTFLEVNTIFQVLYEKLFYQYMIKLKYHSIDTVVNLVNNRSTELNSRVVIAGLLAFVSKRLTLEEIGAAMLIFSLEEALLKLRPYGLPLDQNLLQKCLKKIQRIVNFNDLKNFMSTLRQQQKNHPQPEIETLRVIPNQQYIGPDQFLLLVSLSQKKSSNLTSIFFHIYLQKEGSSNSYLNTNINQNPNSNSNNSNSNSISNQNISNSKTKPNMASTTINNHIKFQGNDTIKQKKTQQNESNGLKIKQNKNSHNTMMKADKIQGLQFIDGQSNHIKNIQNSDEVFKDIKNYIKQSRPSSSSIQHKKTKSILLINQMKKNIRPSTPSFNHGLQIVSKNQKQFQQIFQNDKDMFLNNKANYTHYFKSKQVLKKKSRDNVFIRHSLKQEKQNIVKIQNERKVKCFSISSPRNTNFITQNTVSIQQNRQTRQTHADSQQFHKKLSYSTSCRSSIAQRFSKRNSKNPTQLHGSNKLSLNSQHSEKNTQIRSNKNNSQYSTYHNNNNDLNNNQIVEQKQKQLKMLKKGSGRKKCLKKYENMEKQKKGRHAFGQWVEVEKGKVYYDFGEDELL